MHWIPDPTPPPPRRTRMDYSDPPVQSSDIPVQTRDNCVRPRDTPVKSHSAQTESRTSPVHTSDTYPGVRHCHKRLTRSSSRLASPQKMQEKEAEKGSPRSQ